MAKKTTVFEYLCYRVERDSLGWWLVDWDYEHETSYGPYPTASAAMRAADRRSGF